MQRFGAVFGVAIGSAIFSAYGRLGSPAAVTDGFKPALAACAALSLLGAIVALGVGPRRRARTSTALQQSRYAMDVRG
jgi:hypothetical protein